MLEAGPQHHAQAAARLLGCAGEVEASDVAQETRSFHEFSFIFHVFPLKIDGK